jgi:hypothetical protein
MNSDYGNMARLLMMGPQMVGDIIPFRRRPQRGEVPGIPETGPMNARGGIGPLPRGYDAKTGEMRFLPPARGIVEIRKEYRNSLTPEKQFASFIEEAMAKGMRSDFLRSDAGKYWAVLQRQRWLSGQDIIPPDAP